MSNYLLALANQKDDQQLRNVLEDNIIDGKIAVSFRKSPSFFLASSINGHSSEIIKCTHLPTNKIIGMASRFKYPAYINGRITNIGYLSDLRIDSAHRNGLLLKKGFAFLEALHKGDPLACYITMIYGDNHKALSTIASQRSGLPKYQFAGKFLTPAIFLDITKPKLLVPNVSFAKATKQNIEKVFQFLNTCNQTKQFAPFYQVSDLKSGRLRGLKIEDIYVAIKHNEIIGMIAAWDQSQFKQVRVEQYSPFLGAVYPFYNMLSTLTPFKKLPRPGEDLKTFYVALVAIQNNNAEIFRALLRYMYRDRARGKWHYFICGLHEQDVLAEALSDYRRIKSYGNLYYIDYNNSLELDEKVPYLECATL